ncbi:MAG TPA: exosortase H [Thermodesulfovibrionales bacterium]|jgi:exosortase H (IPTLxxWG-CTERM-specific)|nr:exosortase H [Thermodesulfovibrionales bacterium]
MQKKRTDKAAKGGKEKKTGRPSIGRFATTYLALMGGFFLLIGLKPIQDMIDLNGIYTQGVVRTTSDLLRFMSIPCSYQGSVIRLPSISLDVKFGCNGLEAVMIYSVAVIAFPSTAKKKIIGIALGFFVIQVINILRIASLAYAALHFKGLFEYLHIYVAQGMMIAVSLGLFFLYLDYARNDKTA